MKNKNNYESLNKFKKNKLWKVLRGVREGEPTVIIIVVEWLHMHNPIATNFKLK